MYTQCVCCINSGELEMGQNVPPVPAWLYRPVLCPTHYLLLLHFHCACMGLFLLLTHLRWVNNGDTYTGPTQQQSTVYKGDTASLAEPLEQVGCFILRCAAGAGTCNFISQAGTSV